MEETRTDVEEAVLTVLEAGDDDDDGENREVLAELAANLIPLTAGIDNAYHLDELIQSMDPDKRPEPFSTNLHDRIEAIYAAEQMRPIKERNEENQK